MTSNDLLTSNQKTFVYNGWRPSFRIYNGSSFPRMCASARMHNLLCAPSVGPGFDAVRATGDTRVRSRANGATYDQIMSAKAR